MGVRVVFSDDPDRLQDIGRADSFMYRALPAPVYCDEGVDSFLGDYYKAETGQVS
jgi:hypothetical protein